MDVIEKSSFYLSQYSWQILLSLAYIAAVSFTGFFLVLRRASFYGLVLSSIAQFSFLLGMFIHHGNHGDAIAMINSGAITDLAHMDLYIFPLTLLIMFPLIYFMSKGISNAESLLALLLVFFMGLIPLTNKLIGGSDLILLKAYFSEILYSPPEMFFHYLPHLITALLLQIIFYRRFLQAGFDNQLAKLQGIPVTSINILYYSLAGFVIAVAVRLLGIYVTMMALLAPGLVALAIFRSMKTAIAGTIVFAICFSAGGFLVSFSFDNLPTEPTLIVFFGLAALVARGIFRKG